MNAKAQLPVDVVSLLLEFAALQEQEEAAALIDSGAAAQQKGSVMLGPDMELYILRINGDEQYPPCPNCGKGMSYFASPDSILLQCNSCDHRLADDEANAYLKKIYAGAKVERRAANWDNYAALTEHYPQNKTG